MSPTKTPHTDPEQWSAHTLAVAGARPEAVNNAPVNHPVTFTSTFHSQAVAGSGDRVYARFANPSWDGFEQLLGQLELATLPALVYSSRPCHWVRAGAPWCCRGTPTTVRSRCWPRWRRLGTW